MWYEEVLLACLIASLVELVLHYFPWRMAIGRDLPRPGAYILGVLGFSIPLAVLFYRWGEQRYLVALIAVITNAGGAVLIVYGLDSMLNSYWLEREQRERIEHERQADD